MDPPETIIDDACAFLRGHSAGELRFDGSTTGFRLDGGSSQVQITNDSGTNWYPLASDVASFAFTYYDGDGNTLSSFPLSAADRASVRRLQMDIQLARSSQTAHLRTAVYLRSFMNEG